MKVSVDNLDMFKVVEEIEKNKAKQSIEDIYNELDDIKNYSDTKDEKVIINVEPKTITPIVKPALPTNIGEYETRFEAFRLLIENVDYQNTNDYVFGHKEALEKYYKEAYSNSKDLYLVEAKVNSEINRFESSDSLHDKGYYDGLFYVLRALRKSKTLLMKKIDSELKKAF